MESPSGVEPESPRLYHGVLTLPQLETFPQRLIALSLFLLSYGLTATQLSVL
jgi:hypothetical protein